MSQKLLHIDQQAEQEATDIASQFMDSANVVGDMSQTYHTDFSQVKLHTDESAAQKTARAGVDAFASGKEIFFGRNVLQPNDPASRGLLAHELAHTMQQDSDFGASGVEVSAPQGAPQGGFLDWFRRLFHRKKKAPAAAQQQDVPPVAAPVANVRAEDIADRLPEATPTGHIGDATALENMQDAFLGSGHAIANSDAALGENFDPTDPIAVARAQVVLNLRGSNSQQAKATQAYRGSIFQGYTENVMDYMKNLEKGGVNMGQIAAGAQKIRPERSAAAYSTGGGIDQIQQDMLTMVAPYLTSDQSIEYLSNMVNTIGQAKVFGGDPKATLNFLMKDVFNKTGAASAAVKLRREEFQDSDATSNVGTEALRTLMSLPDFAEMTGEKLEQLPDTLRPLLRQYQELMQQIHTKMGI